LEVVNIAEEVVTIPGQGKPFLVGDSSLEHYQTFDPFLKTLTEHCNVATIDRSMDR